MKRILEFGCGNGVMGAHYAEQNTVTGIEPDAQALAEDPYENVEQICGDEKVLSRYADGTFWGLQQNPFSNMAGCK